MFNNSNSRIMKTFKVTFFDKDLEVESVQTYHSVVDQSAFLTQVACRIIALDLHRSVRCISEDASYTQVVNTQLEYEFEELEHLFRDEKHA